MGSGRLAPPCFRQFERSLAFWQLLLEGREHTTPPSWCPLWGPGQGNGVPEGEWSLQDRVRSRSPGATRLHTPFQRQGLGSAQQAAIQQVGGPDGEEVEATG